METGATPTCAVCGHLIDVSETVLALERGSGRKTSRAREPELAQTAGLLMHLKCALSWSKDRLVGYDD